MENKHILEFFASFIKEKTGIVYGDHNFYQLQTRLLEIVKIKKMKDIHELYDSFKKKPNISLEKFVLDIATNNETYFFRDPKVFEAISESLVPKIVSRESFNGKINILSAACSSGQEAISISILLSEWMKKNEKSFEFSIDGIDISEQILEKAKSKIYSNLEVGRGLSSELRDRYFSKEDERFWKVKENLSRHISYRQLNLIENFQLKEKYDIILCRNVLIYQDVAGKQNILNKLSKYLQDEGTLILGAGESLLGVSADYSPLSIEGVTFYKKKESLEKEAQSVTKSA